MNSHSYEADVFITYVINKGHTKATAKTYAFLVKSFITLFPEMKTFTMKQVNQALHHFMSNKNNSNYKSLILAAVKKYYEYLIETGQRNDHPCSSMYIKTVRNHYVNYSGLLSTKELQMLMHRKERYTLLKWRNQVVISFLIYQALKVQEVENLKVQHINLSEGLVYIKSTPRGLRRHLNLHPIQQNLLEQYIHKSRNELLKVESDKLIIGSRGYPSTRDQIHYIVSTFKPLFPDRNLTAEVIRQSVISNWLNEKHYSLEQVQLLAGHAWLSSTEKYLETSLDIKREIINRVHPLA